MQSGTSFGAPIVTGITKQVEQETIAYDEYCALRKRIKGDIHQDLSEIDIYDGSSSGSLNINSIFKNV